MHQYLFLFKDFRTVSTIKVSNTGWQQTPQGGAWPLLGKNITSTRSRVKIANCQESGLHFILRHHWRKPSALRVSDTLLPSNSILMDSMQAGASLVCSQFLVNVQFSFLLCSTLGTLGILLVAVECIQADANLNLIISPTYNWCLEARSRSSKTKCLCFSTKEEIW